jgi:hypothetical protein
MARDRDIGYAAVAVTKAIMEKFQDTVPEPENLQVVAGERTISVRHDGRTAEGTRDDLMATVRKATSYTNFWEVLESEGRCID